MNIRKGMRWNFLKCTGVTEIYIWLTIPYISYLLQLTLGFEINSVYWGYITVHVETSLKRKNLMQSWYALLKLQYIWSHSYF